MPLFDVDWCVDFGDEPFDSPHAAAVRALEILLSGDNLVFTVTDKVTEQSYDIEIEFGTDACPHA